MTQFVAQKRNKKVAVHIYPAENIPLDEDPDDRTDVMLSDDRPSALCAGMFGPRVNKYEPVFDVTVVEIAEEDYLQRNGEIIGKICGNCQNIMRARAGEK